MLNIIYKKFNKFYFTIKEKNIYSRNLFIKIIELHYFFDIIIKKGEKMEKRKGDRRKKNVKIINERRKGQRRLVCDCGGKIEVVMDKNGHKFVCLRCGKIY
jgi:hypothetical protein